MTDIVVPKFTEFSVNDLRYFVSELDCPQTYLNGKIPDFGKLFYNLLPRQIDQINIGVENFITLTLQGPNLCLLANISTNDEIHAKFYIYILPMNFYEIRSFN